MAITVVTEGVVKSRSWTGVCQKCQARLIWEDEDAVAINPDKLEGDKSRIQCQTPGCGTFIIGTVHSPE